MSSQMREIGGIMVAVGAVVVDDENRVLLVQHVETKRGGFWYGKWICPGGKLKLGENLVEGMAREVKEETNLDVTVSRGPFTFDRVVKEGSVTRLHVIYIDYVVRVVGGDLKAGSDVGVTRWFSRKELNEHWDELHEDAQRLLRQSGTLEKEDSIVL